MLGCSVILKPEVATVVEVKLLTIVRRSACHITPHNLPISLLWNAIIAAQRYRYDARPVPRPDAPDDARPDARCPDDARIPGAGDGPG